MDEVHPTDAKRRERDLLRLTRAQEHVVSVEQLRRLGYTRGEIQARVRRGEWSRVARGVLLIGAPAVEGRGHLFVAQLRGGPHAFLSHRTAAAAHGLRPIARSHLEVTVIGTAHRRAGLVVHTTTASPHPSEIVTRSGLRCSSVSRILTELAGEGRHAAEIEETLLKAVRRGLVDLSDLDATITRHAGDPGITLVRAVAGRYLDPADRKSGLERAFDAHAANDARIPPYRKNVRLGRYELDCVFDEQKVVVELDGRPYHRAVQDMDRDRGKDVWLQLRGLRIMRITDFRWQYDRDGAVEDLLALLRLGGRAEAA